MKYPLWCCQSCGENIGIIGRFLFPWFHKCKPQEDYGTQSTSHNTGSPKLTAACGGCPLQYVCKGPSLFNTMACRGARSQLRAGA